MLERRELLAADFGPLTSNDHAGSEVAWLASTPAPSAPGLSPWALSGLVAEGEPVAPPIPVDDHYVTLEDELLWVDATSPYPVLIDNDQNLTGQPGPVSVELVDQPQHGVVLLVDASNGSFAYLPFEGQNQPDHFTYRLVVDAAGGDDDPTIDEPLLGTVFISITPVNDPPQFDVTDRADFAEQSSPELIVWSNVLENILPGRPVSIDELETQDVVVELLPEASTIPSSLFLVMPSVVPHNNADGRLTAIDLQFVPQPDEWGTAQLVLRVSDTDPLDPKHELVTVAIHVHPINNAPIPNPAVLGESDERGDDLQYSVSDADYPGIPTITYTIAEDRELFIPVKRVPGGIGYNPVGVLDVLLPGPANEIAPGPGGGQTLSVDWPMDDLGQPETLSSEQGGQVTPVYEAGELIGFRYQPRLDFNSAFGIVDRLPAFRVTDRAADGLESWDPETGTMVPDPLTSLVGVQIHINPVNDPPQFELNTTEVSVGEDSGAYRFHLFANHVYAGPPESAFDEMNQSVTLSLAGISSGVDTLFEVAPEIGDVATGWALTFKPAADMFGTAVFEVRATDNGPDNAVRGDTVSSPPQFLTITIQPANDRPVLIPGAHLSFSVNEDAMVLQSDGTVGQEPAFIPLRGTNGQLGLLDVFVAGPDNEVEPGSPAGNQQVFLAGSFPTFTVNGGRLHAVYDSGSPAQLIGYSYYPKADFNGEDSFIYGVIDDGMSATLDGTFYSDPQTAFNTVRLNVLPLNDRPQFSGPVSVTVMEDATTTESVGLSVIPRFVTEIMAGPAGAHDELHPVTGQTVSFVITPLDGHAAALFSEQPQVLPDGTLLFRTAADANGQVVFTIHAVDNGPSNPPLEYNVSNARTFTITVVPVNDPPTFTATTDSITIAEDSGPFVSPEPVAIDISPGPPDEASQTVRFEVTVPEGSRSLFHVLPSVSDNGFLRFTPALDAVGSTVVSLVAIDSEEARSAAVALTITITEVNDAPTAGNVALSSDEDSLLPIPLQWLIDAADDPDLITNPAEFLEVIELASSSQAGATVRLNAQGIIEYDPREAMLIQALQVGQTLVDTFSYRIRDAAGATSNVAHVSITLSGLNDAPWVVDDLVTLSPSGSTRIDPLANDSDVDGIIDRSTIRIDSLPAFGTVVIEPDGTLIYTPFANFRGTDMMAYSVADDRGLRSELAWITITQNTPPVAVADVAQTFLGEPVLIDVAANDFDPDGVLDLTSLQITTHPLRGTAAVLADGIVQYVPNSDFVGTETFQYTIRDSQGQVSAPATVRVQVLASRLQNPGNRFDVNASGQVTPLDALLILNRLAAAARQGRGPSIPVEELLGESPLRFYDVDGNRRVELNDANLVLTELSRLNRANRPAEGEGPLATPAIASPALSPLTSTPASDGVLSRNDPDRPLRSLDSEVFGPVALRSLVGEVRQPTDDTLQRVADDGRSQSQTEDELAARHPSLDAVMAQWDLVP